MNLHGDPGADVFTAGQRIGNEMARGIDESLGRLRGRHELIAGNPNANIR